MLQRKLNLPAMGKTGRSSLGYVGSRIVNIVARLCYLVIVARALGDALYGDLVHAQAWYLAFAPLAGLGVGAWLSRETNARPDEWSRLTSTGQFIQIRSILLASILCLATSLALVEDTRLHWVLFLFTLAIAGRTLTNWGDIMFVSREEGHIPLRISVPFRVLEPATAALILYLGGGLPELAGAHAAIWNAQGLFTYWLLRKRHPWARTRVIAADWRSALPESVKFLGFAWATVLTFQLPIILFNAQASSASGSFALTVQLLITFGALSAAFGQSLLPALTRAVTRKDPRAFSHVAKAQVAALTVGIVLAGIAIPLAPPVIELVLGSGYRVIGNWLPMVCLVMVISASASLLHQLNFARGRHALPTIIRGSSLAVSAALVTILVPRMGPAGGIIAIAAGLLMDWVIALLNLYPSWRSIMIVAIGALTLGGLSFLAASP